MRRATITVPDELDAALEAFMRVQPARPSLTSVVETALEAYLGAPTAEPTFTSRIVDVMRLRSQLVERAHERGATALGLFGSVARAADGPESDVDLWVEVGPDMGMFELAALRDDFARMLGAPVDVLTLGGLAEAESATLRAASLEL